MLRRIISGGQTGVDRAALDAALAVGVEHGGWCPAGRKAEDGVIETCYRLTETESPGYMARTRANVMEADATLILNIGRLSGGTLSTVKFATSLDKPYLKVDLKRRPDVRAVVDWLIKRDVEVLNVAGPRESKEPGIHNKSLSLLKAVLDELSPGG